MNIEQHPLFRLAQARFEESRYARRAESARIDADFTARAGQRAAESADRAAQSAAVLARLDRRAAEQRPEPEKPRWVPKANRQVVMSFGDEDLRAESAQTAPIPVQATPPLPSLPQVVPTPLPPPVPEAPPQRYLSFGADEDEVDAPPPPPPTAERRPARPTRPAADPDDDDLSGHSWMR